MRLDMPERSTPRLWLRPVEEGDACDLFEIYKDPKVTKFLTLRPHTTVDQTLTSIKTYLLPYEKRGVPQSWVMEDKKQEKVIGLCNVHTLEDDIGEIGYLLHPDYWGQGLMKEALHELVEVSFTHLGIRRLEALYDKDNKASERVLANCGFTLEGCLRQYVMLSDGLYHDMMLAAILKDDERMITHGKNFRNKI